MRSYTVTVNGKIYDVTVEKNEDGTPSVQKVRESASVPPAEKPVSKTAAPAAQETLPAGKIRVEAPMIGKILAVKAVQGQTVTKGEPLFVLEAMKMENDIVAPEDGTVASVNCAVGDRVESGALLATLG